MKGFSDAERDRIREELLETGAELFARYGLQKTTIADLTGPVGIANGTFYQFFDSKERLYLDVAEREGHAVADEIVANSFAVEDDPELAIQRFMALLAEEMEENPLFMQLVAGEELEKVMRAVGDITEEEMESLQAASLAHMLPYIETWQAEGRVREGDPLAIGGMMGMVKYLTVYREQVGQYYPAMRDMLIETIAAGLTCTTD
ncbi:transcription regulation protein [Haladaptatus sp. R4]|uniref:TetR/AcrR family transcriptional regulator n=1 Tax=Haladaptatus sp. R4 TaxID=1679489 RepID=UPI0007B498E3|nr:TetR/AcrR family transcriptional regulator [Haladaptatus sp. R4]KZN24528.1 transcription regulation protein [Haladaptatus sp. R4]